MMILFFPMKLSVSSKDKLKISDDLSLNFNEGVLQSTRDGKDVLAELSFYIDFWLKLIFNEMWDFVICMFNFKFANNCWRW